MVQTLFFGYILSRKYDFWMFQTNFASKSPMFHRNSVTGKNASQNSDHGIFLQLSRKLQTGKRATPTVELIKPALRLAPSANGFSYPNPIASLDAEAEIRRDRPVLPRLGQRRFKYDDHGRSHVESCYLETAGRASEHAFKMQHSNKQLEYQPVCQVFNQ